jgi:long-subunit fatty acid transport protein
VLYDPTNPAVVPILGSVGETLPVKQTFGLDWRNSISLRLGFETDFTDVDTFRCGYAYHPSSSPDASLNPYLDGVLEHAFSLGYSRKVQKVIVNAAYQYNFGPARHIGDSSFVGPLFDNSDFNAQAHFAMLSLLVPF